MELMTAGSAGFALTRLGERLSAARRFCDGGSGCGCEYGRWDGCPGGGGDRVAAMAGSAPAMGRSQIGR